MSSRPDLSLAHWGRPSFAVTEVKGRPPLALDLVTPCAADVSRSPRTKRRRAKCGQIPERFAKCSVLRGDSVDQREDREHVIKCMDVQEFRTHSRCDGLPHVAPIRDSEESEPQRKRWWVKMDNYPNGDMFQYIVNNGKPPVDLAYKWAQQIAIGLDGIHNAGVIHRDIKPENILLDADLNAYIADFGEAYVGGFGIHIKHSTCAPTMNYGRPHIEMSTYTDKQDDWWSFGVIVFSILTRSGFDLPTYNTDDGDLLAHDGSELYVWLSDSISDTGVRNDTQYNALTQVVYYAMHYNPTSGKCDIKQPIDINKIHTLLKIPQQSKEVLPQVRKRSSRSQSKTKRRRKRSTTSKDSRTKRPSSSSQRKSKR